MFQRLIELGSKLFSLTRQTEQNTADIKELREQVRSLSAVVERLAYELQRTRENEAHEREKIALRLENTLLRFERRLPPARGQQEEGRQ